MSDAGEVDRPATLRLGVVGSSAGNGHPYSWSAILNGYDSYRMQSCPFPVIPDYLSQHEIVPGSLGAVVSHVWCPNPEEAEQVAGAANIPMVAESLDALLAEVDGVLHARDDHENHAAFAARYTAAGLPVYIDKPIATTREGAASILAMDPDDDLIFTCSALRFAPELDPFLADAGRTVERVEATGPKDWRRYAIHLIEPSVRLVGVQGPLSQWTATDSMGSRKASFVWANGGSISVETTGRSDTPFTLCVDGSTITLLDTYEAFRRALGQFVRFCHSRELPITRSNTLRIVDLIERGDM